MLGKLKWEDLRKWRFETVCTGSRRANEPKSAVGLLGSAEGPLELGGYECTAEPICLLNLCRHRKS